MRTGRPTRWRRTPAEGTAIGVVASAQDADRDDTVSYSVDDARFTVDPDGTVRVAAGAASTRRRSRR
jgi:hypothetical protein